MYRLMIDVRDIEECEPPEGVTLTEFMDAVACELIAELFPREAYQIYFTSDAPARTIILRSSEEHFLEEIALRANACAGEIYAHQVTSQ